LAAALESEYDRRLQITRTTVEITLIR